MIVQLDNTQKILDESVVLDSNFTPISSIPVVENSRLGCNIISYNDINEISCAYECLDEDSYMAICIANNIDPDNTVVAVNEADLIITPDIVKPFSDRYVVDPIIVDEATEFTVDYLINEAYENEDLGYLDYLTEDTYEVLNEILDNIPAGQRAAIRKMILGKKKRETTAAEWNYAANPQNSFDTKAAANLYWRKTGRDASGVTSMIKNAYKQNREAAPKPTPSPAPSGGEEAAKKYLLDKSHKKWAARRDAILKRRKIIGKAKEYGAPAALGVGIGTVASLGYLHLKKVSAMKNKLKSLENQLQTAPPEKQGIIRRMIERIKAIIRSIVNKVRGE